ILIRALFAAGCRVIAYDPVAAKEALRVLVAEHGEATCAKLLVMANSAEDAVRGADVLVLVTEWKEFRSPDWQFLAQTLARRAVFD
ncbi:UDP-glucose 6-dehydrogenase, partial [Acinetobacter baumannii]|nr:UDP-glucose 6-dehydrogenase [Acinetobacter baumannii]